MSELPKWKVAIIGSGNWGSAIARIIGINTLKQPDLFDATDVRMWCFEEQVNGRPLTEQFNELHENIKYLPGIKIADHVRATPDLLEAVRGADALIFVLPQYRLLPPSPNRKAPITNLLPLLIFQFIPKVCDQLQGHVSPTARAISLVKGVEVHASHISLLPDTISTHLSIPCSALSGANIANEAAIMRIGLLEMRKFSMEFFPDVQSETFVGESAGVADLITSCLGGRNRKVAEAFVTANKTFDELEEEMLSGQKLQGVQTARELHIFLKARDKVDEYPLFTAVYRIAYEGVDPADITSHI
ncbi:hypothetical protein RQP46_008620 [Phenoliferia psychrophenolica]